MWVDHFSCYLHANCHEQATIQSTLESKESFDLFTKRYNIWIKTFTAIMVCSQQKLSKTTLLLVINSNLFVALVHTGRTVSLSATSASSQPTPAPCSCMQCKCGQMLLLQRSEEFWSYAFLHTVHLHNCTPQLNKMKSPFNLFTYEDMNHTPNNFRVFGSPVYVLDPTLQSGTLGPGKWKERSYQGIYVGHSPHHVSNVILMYNPKT